MTKTTPTREIIRSRKFKRDYKRYLKSGIDFKLDFESIIELLINYDEIPMKYRDHQLANCKEFTDCRELHIKPDLLLVYRLSEASVELLQLGSHSDLFE
jgi:mRNA interferase YafQ